MYKTPPSPTVLGRFSRRRGPLFTAVTLVAWLAVNIACRKYGYDIKVPSRASFEEEFQGSYSGVSDSVRIDEETLISPSHTLLRHADPETGDFAPRYDYIKGLGCGYEGQADLFADTETGATVVIKTFFTSTRQEPIPAALLSRLQSTHSITNITNWPVELSATLRTYPVLPSAPSAAITHALDAFLDTSSTKVLPWRLVFPFYPSDSLDSAVHALSFLNLTVADLDFLYRPRYAAVFAALARMHAAGFCHDDVKLDNIFQRSDATGLILADLGQVRPLDHVWHRPWRDCRLVDAERAWRSYLLLLRGGSDRSNSTAAEQAGFDDGFKPEQGRRLPEWAAEYWRWKNELVLPADLVRDGGFWAMLPPREVVAFPRNKAGGGEIEWVFLGRDQALGEVEAVRRQLKQYKAANSSEEEGVERPWWWWDRPPVPRWDADVHRELLVTVSDGAEFCGMVPIRKQKEERRKMRQLRNQPPPLPP